MFQVLKKEKERMNKQGCQASQQTKYVICFKKENHSCCLFKKFYYDMFVFPKPVLCSVLQGVKGREKLSFVRGAPMEHKSS